MGKPRRNGIILIDFIIFHCPPESIGKILFNIRVVFLSLFIIAHVPSSPPRPLANPRPSLPAPTHWPASPSRCSPWSPGRRGEQYISMGRCRRDMAGFARASIGALLVSAVHESTSEWKGDNKIEEGAMLPFDKYRWSHTACPVLFIISVIHSLSWHWYI